MNASKGRAGAVHAPAQTRGTARRRLACGIALALLPVVLQAQAPPLDPARWPELQAPIPRDAALEARVAALLARMSVEEKVGQIVQADINSATPEDVRKYHLGSVLAGGNSEPGGISEPGGRYDAPPQEWLDIADRFYEASMDSADGKAAIPILFGIDAVHGHNNLVGATLFPHNIGLGATRNPELIRRIGEATAAEVRSTGMEWTFAPTLTVPRDDRWGRTYEGYSEDPRLVADYAAAAIEGLQGKLGSKQFLDGAHVIASAKHFLADGGTFEGRDQGDARIGEDELRRVHGAGYPPALQAGAQTVMASFSSWQGRKMHGNQELLTGLLKQRWHFDGFVVGDWNAHGQLPGCRNEDCAAAFNAGVDMLMAPDSWRGYYENALKQVRSGEIAMARLDDAVARILRVKLRLGLFEAGKPSQRPLGGKFELLGSPAHRAVARQAVRESLVLLKNDAATLPISPKARVLVVGAAADDVARQSGGWTLNWQGTGLKPADFPNAQSIWSGLREQIQAGGGEAELSADGRHARKPDVAIYVYGEEPYAEFQGDLRTLAFRPTRNPELETIRKLKADGIPVVSVLLSGRPLWVNREINASDAFVAAWLPGSEGGGIADVLLRGRDGKVQHDFKGKLSYSWPKTAVQVVNVGDRDYAPQFAFGYGLSYAEGGKVGVLAEDPGAADIDPRSMQFLGRGALPRGWRLRATAQGKASEAIKPPLAAGAALAVTAVDYRAQEDAWRLQWKDAARLEWVADAPVELVRETNGDVQLLITLKADALGEGEVALLAGCGPKCEAQLPLGAALRGLPRGQWQRIGVPLKCLRAAGAEMAKLEVPFGLQAGAGTTLTLHEVAYGTDAETVIDCKRQ
ncbi:exo 1,3/1,4-beta-D-glucan glucohydrolase [Lysobacter sp. BMK333-48F3]|uniref:glycoside hydrolase family 3 protein n=1 Tax=Lysobacter sp. BMK333-48F3 TaxID=2867962 RepID=UPI001C8BCCBB|nr:glycoside hydrolase family 3 protein [Lysobacter sp. BMK333-48F3]MBX9401224.1 exo 1,3/1,4-beta-D-glucan glucohydrolase [Lysobacter sp. BMK333-48F3]